ncbi:MAG TPA: recombinase family protein [Bacilli bacterium]|nr:recombinase family protein [Bacilli bacterium]
MTHKRAINRGERQQFLIKHNHEAVVSEELWDKAKEIRKTRFHNQLGNTGTFAKYLNKYPFTGPLMCMPCGASYNEDIGTMVIPLKEWSFNARAY